MLKVVIGHWIDDAGLLTPGRCDLWAEGGRLHSDASPFFREPVTARQYDYGRTDAVITNGVWRFLASAEDCARIGLPVEQLEAGRA